MKILKSLVIIIALVVVATGATSAAFSSEARVVGNTFATGILEIRINELTNTTGFHVTNAAPGTSKLGQFTLENYGAPWFPTGYSTLPAKVLTLKAVQTGGSNYLYSALMINVTKDAGGTPETIYSGPIMGFNGSDALLSYYHGSGLVPGSSETIKYAVSLPSDTNSTYSGLSVTFDFVADGATN